LCFVCQKQTFLFDNDIQNNKMSGNLCVRDASCPFLHLYYSVLQHSLSYAHVVSKSSTIRNDQMLLFICLAPGLKNPEEHGLDPGLIPRSLFHPGLSLSYTLPSSLWIVHLHKK